MTTRDPATAPPRPDLDFLRRRTRARITVAPSPPRPGTHGFAFLRSRTRGAGGSTPPPAPVAPPAPAAPPAPIATPPRPAAAPTAPRREPVASTSLDLDTPATSPAPPASSTSLDLDGPPAPPVPPATSTSLDLDPAPAPADAPTASTSLDLDPAPVAPMSAPAPPGAQPTAARTPAAATARRPDADDRVSAGRRRILTITDPTATLNRVQSAVGALTFEARCGDSVGDLRLGSAYSLSSGPESIVQRASGIRSGPRNSRRPAIVGAREQYEQITVDLRQSRDVERLIVYAFSESAVLTGQGEQLRWGGTLVTSTFGGARIELPLELAPSAGVLVLMSMYNVRGEFVLRAEMELLSGSVRDATRAFGFDRITWLDGSNPLE